jgi:hypothetical protein
MSHAAVGVRARLAVHAPARRASDTSASRPLASASFAGCYSPEQWPRHRHGGPSLEFQRSNPSVVPVFSETLARGDYQRPVRRPIFPAVGRCGGAIAGPGGGAEMQGRAVALSEPACPVLTGDEAIGGS